MSSTHGWHSSSPSISAGPTAPPSYSAQPSYNANYAQSYPQQQPYYGQPANEGYAQPTPPQIRNPFVAPPSNTTQHTNGGYGESSGFDPEVEAQIQQWQNAYAAKDENAATDKKAGGSHSAGGANAIPLGSRPSAPTPLSNQEVAAAVKTDTGVASVIEGSDGRQKTVVRSGGGETWQDASLLEWDPAHFRIFVGNLAGEVTDESLLKAFSKYHSVQKARVVRDKRTTKSKGFGFVSFSDGDQYFKAVQEMQGKYIGSHPVILRKSTTEIKPTVPVDKRKMGKNGKRGGGKFDGANTGAGVHKKQGKAKGGMKVLG